MYRSSDGISIGCLTTPAIVNYVEESQRMKQGKPSSWGEFVVVDLGGTNLGFG